MGSKQLAVVPVGSEGTPKTKGENFQTERDKFLKDFEKPTQIYRYLRTRMLVSPLFLYRNLAYMKNRNTRTQKGRKTFKIDDILQQVQASQSKTVLTKKLSKNYLNLIILGFWDGQTWLQDTEAKVDLNIIRICVKKRKDTRVPINKAFSGSCSIKVKSPEESICKEEFSIPIAKGKYPVMAVPKECFNLVNGHVVQSIRLVVRVSVPTAGLISKDDKDNVKKELTNSDSTNSGGTRSSLVNGRQSLPGGNGVNLRKTSLVPENSEEPKAKRQRSLPTKDRENFVYQDPTKGKHITENVVYVGLLTIYDKDNNINIPAQGNADLEFRLNKQEDRRTGVPVKRVAREGSWETSLQPDNAKIQEYLFKNGTGCPAKLAVALRASNDKMGPMIGMVAPVTLSVKETKEPEEQSEKHENVRVVYQFVQGNMARQMTESRNDVRCPWCSMNCLVMYSLLKHLKICHPRFRFNFAPIANGARVDVSINESYDGSYTGSAYDLVAQPPGEAFARNGPAKRTQVFCMITFKPPPLKRNLQEFFDSEEKNGEQSRSYMTGHNRLYHHTTTCLPIHPREIDVDSEGEPDPEWLRVKTCMMIDEFTDVNEGEKEIMKMWNHHVMRDNYVGDCQIPLACMRFVKRYGQKIIEKNLYRNFILHLTNLYDFGLLPAQGLQSTVQSLHFQMKDNNSALVLKRSWISSLSPASSSILLNGNVEPMDVDCSPILKRRTNGNVPATHKSDQNGL